ncbi:heparan-alpha-glucosaminide N-acetyltransferase domain-containing protein [Methanoculleus sp.]|uniref:heparan-alpha-glucosaminide N-acetyltransferase domain-containing protein n=1 Tax=Methanoculleus sp. TaxID=90427 RepID=UPI0025FF6297|nr:heparan-alpha-glucosaminide N-acetyltransferase domain-containing protein [Methanoculleus sp.]
MKSVAKTGSFRDIPVDILRGLAITLMIMANLTPALLLPPAPGWYRFLSSLAAPLFIGLAGMMVALSRTGKGRPLSYMATRGGLVILAGVFLHLLVFDCVPFLDMEVLYLIGLSLPLAYLYLGLPERKRWAVIVAIVCITPLLHAGFGYSEEAIVTPYVTLVPFSISDDPFPAPLDVVRAWFVDGWFPVFPWLAVALFGAEVGVHRWRDRTLPRFRFQNEGLYGFGLVLAGAALWTLFPGAQYIREGYVEFFYPPATGLLLLSAGLIPLGLTVLDHLRGQYALMDPLRAAGECSLAIYIVHYAIIVKVVEPLLIQLPLPAYMATYLVLFAGMILLAYLLRHVRTSWRGQPFLVRFLIGS